MKKNKISRILKVIDEDLINQNKLYKPTTFWINLSKKFSQILIKEGFNKFRQGKLQNNFFVPLYHHYREKNIYKLLKYSQKKIFSNKVKFLVKDLINGKNEAFSDFRVFKSADNILKKPYLHRFTENNFGNPLEKFQFDNRIYSKSSLNYLLGLTLLKQNSKNFTPATILEIGGGFGILGEIFKYSGIKNFKYINVDLPPLSFLTENFLINSFGSKNVSGYLETRQLNKIDINRLKKGSSLCSWQIEKLKGKIDLFVNFISFQEMEPEVVKNYLLKVINLKPKYILLRNLREGKQIKKKK